MLVLVMEHLHQVELPRVTTQLPRHEAEGGCGVGEGAQPSVEAGDLVGGQAEVNWEAPGLQPEDKSDVTRN